MAQPKRPVAAELSSAAEVAAAVEAIGRLHYMFGDINGLLTKAKFAARTLLEHSNALPGGVPREAALAFARLRLEVAHGNTLTLETLRSVVEAVSVPEVTKSEVCMKDRK